MRSWYSCTRAARSARDLGGNLVGEGGRRRALLRRVREGPQPIKADLVEKLEQALDGGLGLAGEAEEHGRAHGHAGDGLPKRGDDLAHAARGDRPAHGAQDAVVAVLDGHVEIGHDPGARPLVEQAVVHVGGMQIHGPDPGNAGVAEREQQIADVAVAGSIASVGQRVLRDENGLLDPTAAQLFDLAHDVGQSPAAVAAAKLRDRTEGAAHVAALGDLHVRVGHARREQTGGGRVIEIAGRGRRRPVVTASGLAHQVDHAMELRGAEDAVDLGNLAQHLPAVALGQAAGDDQGPTAPLLLELGQLEDRLHRLLPAPDR